MRWESDIEDWKLIMLKLYILLAVVVWLAMQSQKNTQARLAAGVQSFHARRMDMWCVLLFLALLYVAGLRTSFNDSPLSSKKQKNNCRQRHPGFGCPFFNSFQGIFSLAAA